MSKKLFIELIEGFCVMAGLDKAQPLLNGESIQVNDVGFSFVHNEEVDPGIISIFADFGKIPAKKEAEVCKALLEANLYLYLEHGPIFTMSPKYKHVICADRRALGHVTPEGLRDLLKHLAAQAKEWRTNYFLELKPDTVRSGRSNLSLLRALDVKSDS